MNRRKKIFNSSEKPTYTALGEVVSQYNAKTFPKVRIADTLHIGSSNLSKDEYSYALKAHFDFVVADEDDSVLFAVEFDGPHHSSDEVVIANDKKKNEICRKLGMPLLRISSDFLAQKTDNFTLLNWLVDLWFINQSFYEVREAGGLPPDAIFFYDLVSTISPDGKSTNYDLAGSSINFLHKCYKQGLCEDYCPTIYTLLGDMRGYVRTKACFRITDEEIVVGEANCRSFHFSPVSDRELSDDLAFIDVAKKLKRIVDGKDKPRTRAWADNEIDNFRKLASLSKRGLIRTGSADRYGSESHIRKMG